MYSPKILSSKEPLYYDYREQVEYPVMREAAWFKLILVYLAHEIGDYGHEARDL